MRSTATPSPYTSHTLSVTPESRGRMRTADSDPEPGSQNVTPTCTWNAREVTKCVPLNVDRKLYRACLFVTLITLNRARSFALSPCSRLSTPNPRSNRLRGAIQRDQCDEQTGPV